MLLSYESLRTFTLEGIKFAAVGVINTIIGAGLFSLFFYILKIHYLPANIISTVIALTNSYFMNKYWTFRKKSFKKSEILFFILIFFSAFGIQNASLILLNEKAGMSGILPYLIASVLYTVTGFFGNKFITFSKRI